MDVLLDALGYQARKPHQEDVFTSSTDAQEELLATFVRRLYLVAEEGRLNYRANLLDLPP